MKLKGCFDQFPGQLHAGGFPHVQSSIRCCSIFECELLRVHGPACSSKRGPMRFLWFWTWMPEKMNEADLDV